MADLHQCEFFLLRWMPDVVTGEFTNVGLVLLDDSGRAHVRFTTNWRRAKCLDPTIEIELFESLEADIRARLNDGADRQKFLEKVPDWASNSLQLSASAGVLAKSVEAELENLALMYLEPRRRTARRDVSGRAAILNSMRGAFEQAGVWDLMWKRIPVAQYTRKGDPLRIDCGYRPNGVIRLFHAVPLMSDLDVAKVLAFSYPQVREGIARAEQAKAELTVIVEDDLDREDESVAFAVATFERTEIAVAAMGEMAHIADVARRELRL